ncbi:hypothetical protein CEK26_012727 [Fusarium fujikuroi]|uniref:Uncharacterized protein n=1 Tax=Fusarium fujikuroi TaxID=5127 RepID=A0A5Q3F5B6_FUSFU|nr:hypothetical protein CEK27_012740 [Fusarium fujikuroi]QGI85957.1 hypothetical protein CEK25_012686 [Fusarium fujikuroi]QGI86138.1 hypothetical protein CEK25_012867 [Fusarium fujikuroi]QGI99658.1 hypothetical protein CEK26_012727 [Fusarium fujikuroi]VTT60544.1 unnamed protein product [Fusarium fujikuroi]
MNFPMGLIPTCNFRAYGDYYDTILQPCLDLKHMPGLCGGWSFSRKMSVGFIADCNQQVSPIKCAPRERKPLVVHGNNILNRTCRQWTSNPTPDNPPLRSPALLTDHSIFLTQKALDVKVLSATYPFEWERGTQ